MNTTMTRIEQRSLHMPISLDLEFMLSSSGTYVRILLLVLLYIRTYIASRVHNIYNIYIRILIALIVHCRVVNC